MMLQYLSVEEGDEKFSVVLLSESSHCSSFRFL